MDKAISISNELINLLQEKNQHLTQILNYTKLQTKAIDEQNEQKLNEYIEEKQKLIDVIDILDKRFVDNYNLLKSTIGVNSLDEISNPSIHLKNVKSELGKVYNLVEQIMSLEKENSVKLNQQYDDIKSKLREVSGGKKIASAYDIKPISNGGAFFDTKK